MLFYTTTISRKGQSQVRQDYISNTVLKKIKNQQSQGKYIKAEERSSWKI